MYEWKEHDYALYRSKRKTENWEGKSITGQICYAIWQIQEVKCTVDALEKQTTSAYNKAKNSGSDLHALVVVYIVNHIIHNTGSLRNFLTKDSRVEKEAGTRTGRSWEKLRKKQKALYYLTEKKGCLFSFLASAKFFKFNLTGYNIWVVARNSQTSFFL